MDITLGAELRRVGHLMEIAATMPLWERPQYLMERLPQSLLDPKLQLFRVEAAQKAWNVIQKCLWNAFCRCFLMRTAISAKKRKSTNLTLIFRGNPSAIAEERSARIEKISYCFK